MTIQDTLRSKMKEAGITQEELGRRCGIAKQNVNRRLSNDAQRFSSTLALAQGIGLECRIITADGAPLDSGRTSLVIETACRTEVSTEPFRAILESLGLYLVFDWPTERRNEA